MWGLSLSKQVTIVTWLGQDYKRIMWAGLHLFGGSCIPIVFVSHSSLTHAISFSEPVE